MTKRDRAFKKVVEYFGSQAEMARFFGVTRQCVSIWKATTIPIKHVKTMVKKTKGAVSLKDLRPDIY